LSIKTLGEYKNEKKYPNEVCKDRVKSRRDLDTIWSKLGDGAEIGSTIGTDGTEQYGPCKLRAPQTESGSTIGEAWARCAKIGRGTDRRSVPSIVLVPDQPEMKKCKNRAPVQLEERRPDQSELMDVCG